MINELSFKDGKTAQKIIMSFASLIIILVATTHKTGLFYKSYQIIYGGIKKEYGPAHTLYYLYIIAVFIYIFIQSSKQLKKNNVSRYSISLLDASAIIILISIFLDNFLHTGFHFDALGLLLSEFFFIALSKRLPLYDLEDATKEANQKAQRTGLIAFDLKRRLLGYNIVVLNHVREFEELKVDSTMPETFIYKPILDGFMDKIDETGHKHFEIVAVKDNYFSFETEPLLIRNKVKGYQIICHDVTEQQKRIKEIENEVLKKSSESDKYLSILNKSIDPKLVSKIISDDALGNQEKEVVILFADISGFTSLSEERPAREIISLLNDVLSFMEKCVVENDGIVDKYIGDCIMAFWDEENIKEASLKACKAAIAIKEAGKKFNERKNHSVNIKFSQGIHSGTSVLGFIGDQMHREYTVIGDTVNTASRLQSAANTNQILISKEIKDAVENKINFKDLGRISLKGKKESINIYDLISIKD